MKPSKSTTNNKNKNKNTTDKKSTSKIQDYFKNTPKEDVEKIGFNDFDVKAFYVKALKDRLKQYSDETENNDVTSEKDLNQEDGACAVVGGASAVVGGASAVVDGANDNAVKTSCDGCKQWEAKYKEMKRSYLKLSLRHSEIDLKYSDLVKATTNTVRSSTDTDSDVVSLPGDIFTGNQLKCLQGIPLEKTKDSNFILQCVRYAYKDNMSDLLGKTLKGRPEHTEFKEDGSVEVHPSKDPLTPAKVKRIEELFINRVIKGNTNAVDQGERIKPAYINKLIASAINNETRKYEAWEKTSSVNLPSS